MKIIRLFEKLSIGALMGCFVICSVWVIIALISGYENFNLSGIEIVNGFFGAVVVGWVFSLGSYIYDIKDISFIFQILIQMILGFTVLFLIAIYLQWMPVNSGWSPVISWIIIAVVFAAAIWCGFYIYYYLMARKLNEKISYENN